MPFNNKEGRLLKVSAPERTLVENTYDGKGRLVQTKDALGRSTGREYDERGLVRAVINPDGSRTELAYDERGNLARLTDPCGGETLYAYDGLNRVIQTRDPEGNRTQYAYDAKDRIIKVTSPEGKEKTYAYNESGKITRITDFDGGETVFTYNSLNRPETITDKEGRVTRRTYDLMWNIKEEILPTGAVTSYGYDRDNRLEKVEIRREEGKEPETVYTYTHDPNGNLLKTLAGDAALLKRTAEGEGPLEEIQEGKALSLASYEYDALNRITARTDGEGRRTEYAYDTFGNLVSVTDPEGNRKTYTYNEAGEKTRETDGKGNTTTYEYNALGRPTSITDPAGRKTIHEYEPGGRLKKTIYPDGRTTAYTYDRNGNIKTRENEEGFLLTYTYDSLNRIKEITGSRGQKKTYTYDALGNVASVTDTEGNTTAYEYTLSGKLAAVTDALGSRTEYRYDPLDNLILVIRKGKEGEEDRTTRYERDPLGRITVMRDASGQEERYAYDALGRITQKTDREGCTTAYTYTMDGKTASIRYGDGKSVEFSYDALRKLARVKDWLGETKIERDRTGGIRKITDHEGKETAYEWGSMGERKSITSPDGRKTLYLYDEMLRLKEMRIQTGTGLTEPVGGRITYCYDPRGRLIQKGYGEGLKTTYAYNELGLPSRLTHEDEEGILDSFSYEYSPAGNRTAIIKERRGLKNESGSYGYGYDALGRLTEVRKDGALLRTYGYDTFGNRKEMEDHEKDRRTVYTYDALNRLTRLEETAGGAMPGEGTERSYTYDHRGNLTGELEGGRLLHGYEYGAINRLTRAWNGEGEEAVYHYNGLLQRTGKELRRGEEEAYTRESCRLDLTRPYHNLLELHKGGKEQYFYFDSSVAVMEEEGRLHYYLLDELGSPVRVSGYGEGGEAGTKDYLTYGYDEFGNDLGRRIGRELEEEGIPDPYGSQGGEQPFGYTGYRYDMVSGTYFAQAREYKPENGRFTAEDVLKGNGAVPETMNRYGYCLGNPINLVDLDGLAPAWLEGIYAHLQFEAEVMAEYWVLCEENPNIDVCTNMFIPFGGVKGGNGFADVAICYYGTMYIYELKPQNHYEDRGKRATGIAQLNGYISSYTARGNEAEEGQIKLIEPLLYMETPFVFDESRKIVYRMYEDTPGMVYYDFIERGQEEQDEAFVMSKEEEEVYKKAQEAVGWSLFNNLGAIADMIEEPETDNILSQIFSPKAIIESILNGNVPMGIGGGGNTCPIFL